MNRVILLCFSFVFTFYSTQNWTTSELPTSVDIYSNKEIKKIRSRYHLSKDTEIFSENHRCTMAMNKTAEIVHALIIHKTLRFEDIDDVLDFADIIAESGLALKTLEPGIIRYLDKGELIFTALGKAIERVYYHEWHVDIVARMSTARGSFVRSIDKLKLSDNKRQRVINVYATCIASFTTEADRKMMEPQVCGVNDNYNKPRFLKHPAAVRTTHNGHKSTHVLAYDALMQEARHVADKHELSTFERVIMAKCIAEQSLRFFVPSHHPFKAFRKNRQLSSTSPEDAFFMRTGVCSNFSGIAYNAALELGLSGKIHLAKNGLHVYLEFEEGGEWFHAHPFNSKSKCDISRFPVKKSISDHG